MPYRAPTSDFRFLLSHVVGFPEVQQTERFAEATDDTTDAILNEAAKLCDEVLAPLQRAGDLHPARIENGVVRCSPGFAEGYAAIRDGGWVGISAPAAFGGLALPQTLATCVNEMMSGACLALQLNPLMTQGQIEALEHHADDALKALYLPRLISGEWSGTMNLTEPHAGSDVGALTSKASDNGDGTYAVTGQKIYISWGDNDFTPNICHLVLARLPGGGPGTKGISLFLVPKFLPDAAGEPGQPNSLQVVSLEHKMGLHGSPTAVMQYDGATGWLVGEPHQGMKAMFTMMNNARLGVGVQGIGQAEAACQLALEHALTRKQGRTASGAETIIGHPDVRRMLGQMRADTFAARGIALMNAVATDMAHATGSADWQARAAFLTPITKAFGTDTGVRTAELGMQVHGGMGFIEETGAAQIYRDVRVTSIYEGTNGIQALDLVGRKLADGGEAAHRLLDEIEQVAEAARAQLPVQAKAVWSGSESLREVTEWLAQQPLADRGAVATAYLRAFARVLGGHVHLCAANAEFAETGQPGPRNRLACFYVQRLLSELGGLLVEVRSGPGCVDALTAEDLAG
ncbi:acyl-CoA dehydrogenase [Frigidibacter sp. ROC022]|uniref:acyl-CoA dehydrogenase n=1 Tax=Frigidibacter sp. ROC022 TaxID=2971796 RepID=UPI00215A739E|nr:acyl-CoA dehydrogenase [Frigidibacter sp. ROC022]MCR8724927.1 acyl-CoA dehydrogenase family protein [Frigidibacter sp. ROC022]